MTPSPQQQAKILLTQSSIPTPLVTLTEGTGFVEVGAEQTIDSPLDQEFAFVSDCRNLDAMTPAFLRFHVLNDPIPALAVGTILRYRLRVHGLPLNWASRIIKWDPSRTFTYEQLHGPFRRWTHRHEFDVHRDGVRVRDIMRLSLRGHWLRRTPVYRWVARDLERIMQHRQSILAGQLGGAL
jgi:ligand-binding SRPBCC domain-containing protein